MTLSDRQALNDVESSTPGQLLPGNSVLQPGELIAERICIDSLVGHGGSGTVYKAKQVGVDRAVAVKTLHLSHAFDKDAVARFYREAKLIASLDHPNIVKVFSVGASKAGQPYFVMDFIDGLTLADELANGGLDTFEDFCAVFIPVLQGLQHAHEKGVVHRDIKPRNIIIERAEHSIVPHIVDFGLARLAEGDQQRITHTGAAIGSPVYMSPEQCMGKQLDSRSDFYSLGCVMYQVLTGSPPFTHDNPAELLHAHLVERAAPIGTMRVKNCPEGLRAIVARSLEKDPAKRYQTAEEMLHDIELVRGGKAPVLKIVEDSPKPSNRLRISPAVVLVSALLLCAAATGFFLYQNVQQAEALTKKQQAKRASILYEADHLAERAIHVRHRQKFQEAEEKLAQAYRLYQSVAYEGDQLADVCLDRARCFMGLRQYKAAEVQFQQALEFRRKYDRHPAEAIAQIQHEWGYCMVCDVRYGQALEPLNEAETYYERFKDGPTARTMHHILTLQALIKAAIGTQQLTLAADCYEKLIAAQQAYQTSAQTIADNARAYAELLRQMNRTADADKQLKFAANEEKLAEKE